MTVELNPGLILILGALLIPIAPQMLRGAITIALPILALVHLLSLPMGDMGVINLFNLELVTLRIDRLSFIFGFVFLIAAFMAAVYSLHVPGWLQPMTAMMYAGSAIGAVFSGDLVTLFVFWEITAITSVFLIWAVGTTRSFDTGMRYLLVQVSSGVILLAGVMMYAHANNTIAFGPIFAIDQAGLSDVPLYAWLILVAVGIKCAFPLLHNWLPDAYPDATPTGTVWLSVFTTKLAVYTLARGFPGSDILLPIGAAMVLFPLIFAIVANDLRRVLAYALINQLGFMVIGVGIGTELAISGVAANAFGHVIYKSLLFMAIGAVLYRVGTAKASELGGLGRAMPLTFAFAIIGAASISVPLFAGFVAKSLIMSAAMKGGYFWIWMILLWGSVGVFICAGLRIVYEAFLRTPDSGTAATRAIQPAPWNMVAGMAIASGLSVFIGTNSDVLYAMLPYDVTYTVYTTEHVLTQMQMLLFATLGFALLLATGLYPKARRETLIDSDWLYRKLGYNLGGTTLLLLTQLWRFIAATATSAVMAAERSISRTHNPTGILGRTWTTGVMAFWATVMLAGYLVLFYARYLPT